MAIRTKDITNILGLTNNHTERSELPTNSKFNPEGAGPRKVLLKWEAVTRAHVSPSNTSEKRNRVFIIIGVVLALLLVSMGEFLLIAVVSSIVFIKTILASTAPRTVEHVLSTHGIDYSGDFYGWEELKTFYFRRDGDLDVMCVDTVSRVPGRLYLSLMPGTKDKLKEIVNEYLTYIPVEPRSALDKMYSSVADRINLG